MEGLVDREVIALVVCYYVCFLEEGSAESVLGVVCGLAEGEVVFITGGVGRVWNIRVAQLQIKCSVGKRDIDYLRWG